MDNIVLAIDPGPDESAYVVIKDFKILEFEKVSNKDILFFPFLDRYSDGPPNVVIEQVASYGMAVGKDIFETVFWSGRFFEYFLERGFKCNRMPRAEVKMHLCKSMRAKDKNIITALVDIFDPMRKYGTYGKGTKKNPGPLFGMAADCWQALALAITFSQHKN